MVNREKVHQTRTLPSLHLPSIHPPARSTLSSRNPCLSRQKSLPQRNTTDQYHADTSKIPLTIEDMDSHNRAVRGARASAQNSREDRSNRPISPRQKELNRFRDWGEHYEYNTHSDWSNPQDAEYYYKLKTDHTRK